MSDTWRLTILVLLMLLLERIAVGAVTRRPAGKAWVLRHRLLHPNSISLIRIPMGLISIGIWVAGFHSLAILWFAFWMITDLTDGTIARNCDLTTESGKWLDPLSDKCMYFPALVYFGLTGVLSLPWVIALIVIDSVGQASRLLVKKKAANHFGKAKTALITTLITVTALKTMGGLPWLTPEFLHLLAISCTILAFLSFYCKVIPDVWYANSLTLANFICGIAAIVSALHGHPMRSFLLVFVGQFFDLFDGRLARRFGSTRLGAVYDDIADGTSFGFAIGLLIYLHLGKTPLVAGIALLYVLSVVYRLIRFLRPPYPLPPGIFLGMPAPAGALLAGSSVLLFSELRPLALLLVLLTMGLMVSHIRYRHFGRHIWPTLPNSVKVLAFVLFLVLVNISLAEKSYGGLLSLTAFALAGFYCLYGVQYRKNNGDPGGDAHQDVPPSVGEGTD